MTEPLPHADRHVFLDLLRADAGFLERLPLLASDEEPVPTVVGLGEDPPSAGSRADTDPWVLARRRGEEGRSDLAIEAAVRAAQASLRRGAPAEAAERFAFAVSLHGRRDPRRGPLRRRHAEALAAAGRLRAAARAFAGAALSEPRSRRTELRALRAAALLEAGRFEDARAVAENVLEQVEADDPAGRRAALVHGLALARVGRLAGAEKGLRALIRGDATVDEAELLQALALVRFRRGEREASEELTRAVDGFERAGAERRGLRAMAALAILAAGAGRQARAGELLDTLRERAAAAGRPRVIEAARSACCAIALQRGRVAWALALARESVQATDRVAGLHLAALCRLAEALRVSGRAGEAVRALRVALREVPSDRSPALVDLARVMLAAALLEDAPEEQETARVLLERALGGLRESSEPWATLVGLVVEMERTARPGSTDNQDAVAMEFEARALRDGADAELRCRAATARAAYLSQRGNADAARVAAARAVELASDRGWPLLEAAALAVSRTIGEQAGGHEEAADEADRARRLLDAVSADIDDPVQRRRLLERPVFRGLERRAAVTPDVDRRLLALYEMIRALNSETDPDALLESILDMALRTVRAERGMILLKDSSDDTFSVRLARRLEDDAEADVESISRNVIREAGKGQSLLVIDAGKDDRFRSFRSVSLYGIRSLMCVPLRLHGKIIGTVYLDSRSEPGLFTHDDLRFLEAFAGHATLALENLRRRTELVERNRRLQAAAEVRVRYGSLVGRSPGMQRVFDLIEKFAASELPVLIRGESGTGKELVARAIHAHGPRRRKLFLSENCAAIPDSLLESELFGHVRGAFTGADRDRAGLFAQADGGTLFLDEVGDMSASMQAKLLRALQEGEIRPVGSSETLRVNVRVVAATHRDLEADLASGRFREDLYYRLQVLVAHLPPLRERPEDIPLLCDHLLGRIARERGAKPIRLTSGVLERFERYSWPGNVRQLENTLQRMALGADEGPLTLETIRADPGLRRMLLPGEDRTEPLLSLAVSERERIRQALAAVDGNRERAARLLGISRATIYRKIKQHGLD